MYACKSYHSGNYKLFEERDTHLYGCSLPLMARYVTGAQYKLWDLTSGQDSNISLHFEAL